MAKKNEITIRGTKHANAHEALQHLDCSGDDYAILVANLVLTVTRDEAHRLETAGVEFAYLFDNHGTINTVPVNDR